MARVVLTSTLSHRFTGGEAELQVAARNVRHLIRELESRYPGLGVEIEQAASLTIDGELHRDPFLESLPENAEVFVLPKIAGG